MPELSVCRSWPLITEKNRSRWMGTGLAPSSVLQGAEDVWQFAVIAEAGICLALVKPEALIFPGDHAHAGTLGSQDAIGAVLDGHARLRRKRQHLRCSEIDMR